MKPLSRLPKVILSPYRDRKIALWMKVTLICIWLFWMLAGIIYRGPTRHTILAGMIFLLGADIALTYRQPRPLVTDIIFVLLAALNLHFFASGQIGYFSVFPLLLFSTAVIFILGIRTSIAFNVCLAVLLLYYLRGPKRPEITAIYGDHMVMRFPYLYVCIVGIAYIIMFSIQSYWVEKAQQHEILIRRIRTEKAKLSEISFKVITAMYAALSAKVPGVDRHCAQVAQLSRRIAEKLHLSADDCSAAYSAGLLHEVGAVGLPDEVLDNAILTEEQFEIYKTYVTRGAQIIRELQIADNLADAVLHHRENYDGTGYPDKLAGESISQLSRIIAVADYIDRHRQRGESEEHIRHRLNKQHGTRFDPACVSAALEKKQVAEILPAPLPGAVYTKTQKPRGLMPSGLLL